MQQLSMTAPALARLNGVGGPGRESVIQMPARQNRAVHSAVLVEPDRTDSRRGTDAARPGRSFDAAQSDRDREEVIRAEHDGRTILQYDVPNHLGFWRKCALEHEMALITSDFSVAQAAAAPGFELDEIEWVVVGGCGEASWIETPAVDVLARLCRVRVERTHCCLCCSQIRARSTSWAHAGPWVRAARAAMGQAPPAARRFDRACGACCVPIVPMRFHLHFLLPLSLSRYSSRLLCHCVTQELPYLCFWGSRSCSQYSSACCVTQELPLRFCF